MTDDEMELKVLARINHMYEQNLKGEGVSTIRERASNIDRLCGIIDDICNKHNTQLYHTEVREIANAIANHIIWGK